MQSVGQHIKKFWCCDPWGQFHTKWNHIRFEYTPCRIPELFARYVKASQSSRRQCIEISIRIIFDLVILTFKVDLHAKIQVCMSVRSSARARHTDRHVTDVGCNSNQNMYSTHYGNKWEAIAFSFLPESNMWNWQITFQVNRKRLHVRNVSV